MKILKKIVLFFLLISSLKAETLEMNLVTFASYASETNNINILIDEELKEENIIFIVNDKKNYMLTAFRKALQLRGLQLVKTQDFFYIQKKQIYKETHRYRSIKLNFVRFDDIKNFLSVYDKDIKFEFIKTSKILLVKSNEKDFKSIYEMIKTIDTLPTQLKLKVTIIDTNLNKLKELGSDTTKIVLAENNNLFLNLVSYPFSVKNILDSNESKGFYSFIKALHKNGNTRLVSNPILTLSDEKEAILDAAETIPYKIGSVQIDEKDTKVTSAYEFRKVGLQIKVIPQIYQKNNVYLNLELSVSSILSNVDNLPITSDKHIKQSFHLPVGKAMVLTGINKNEIKTTQSKVPLLSEIPYLGWLFKYETKDENESNLTVIFEVIQEREGV
ncbi:type II secretion system protein GspD [Halarcobacter sp.]|uniref:type II secretion system protein GspD n=1 Tax=Halarcobacter sp. TaxID=2321133 RepID=UPI003A915A8F